VLAEAVLSAQKNKEMQALLERQKLLASELQHRVRNNLHLVIRLLNNYAQSASDDGSRQGINSIANHVVTLTHIYDGLLGMGLSSTIDLSKYLQELCSSCLTSKTDKPEMLISNATRNPSSCFRSTA
jgi:two-component sensor histidine kinase